MSLVRVWTDVGKKKPVPLRAKIVEKDGPIITISYLSQCKDKIWRYEEDTYDIDDSSIEHYFKTDDETAIGFIEKEDGFILLNENLSDKDYEPEIDEEDSDEYSDDDDEDDSDEYSDEDEDFIQDDESDEEDEDEDDNYLDE